MYKPYFVAIPEHRASVLRATRSPKSIFLTGPLTVAQCLTGVKVLPSLMCHSTLAFLLAGIMEAHQDILTYVQSSCLNTSSKNGTPASIP